MVSYSSWNGQPMHGNKQLITGLLKGELQFQGFVVTDWAAIDKMSDDYKQDVEVAINAGIDMVMVPTNYPEFVTDLRELVNAGRVPLARIDDAVRRILRQKVRFKLWERPFADPALTARIGSPEHRAVARKAVQQSLVVLKNDKSVLPLGAGARVHLCGFRADDMGVQCGGWSVGWTGRRGPVTPGTTIRHGFEEVLGSGRVDVLRRTRPARRAPTSSSPSSARTPTPKGSGDRDKLELSADDRALLDRDREAERQARGRGAAVRTAADPGRRAGRRQRRGGRLAARDGGRRGSPTCWAARVKPTGKLPCTWPRSTWRRSRSTSATRATRRCSRTGSASAGDHRRQ